MQQKTEFVRMDCHPITGHPLFEHVITKRERDYKKEYNRAFKRKEAAKNQQKQDENTTTA